MLNDTINYYSTYTSLLRVNENGGATNNILKSAVFQAAHHLIPLVCRFDVAYVNIFTHSPAGHYNELSYCRPNLRWNNVDCHFVVGILQIGKESHHEVILWTDAQNFVWV